MELLQLVTKFFMYNTGKMIMQWTDTMCGKFTQRYDRVCEPMSHAHAHIVHLHMHFPFTEDCSLNDLFASSTLSIKIIVYISIGTLCKIIEQN